MMTVPILESSDQTLHFRPPILLTRSTKVILNRHKQPEDQACSIVGEQIIPRVVVHSMILQNRVIATQHLLFALVLVSLLGSPKRCTQVCEVIASNVD